MTRTAEEIIDHHVAALAAGNVDAVVADYAEDARFVTTDGVVAGRASLAKTIAGIVEQFPGFTVTIVNLVVDDDIVLLEWTADTQGHVLTDGVDTFLIRDDRIQLQTARFTVHAKESFDT
ncbi:nuclear transport factor 2 family protein [Nocardia carnea]|uniref:nuclear transport factor 2 family protein n=2 Tax=Nocardia carnea TaxID=37328 RepID=UPI00245599CE|nr:nuclear transport factor 2 family protein [Nocardia carnea]